MFTDLVASTSLRQELGEDAMDRLLMESYAEWVGVVSGCDGAIVKGTGDGVLAAFESTTAALVAAVTLQQRSSLLMRIGISVGEVSHYCGDLYGGCLVEAARLVEVAKPSEILVSDLIVRILRGRGRHEFEPLGQLHLKGFDEPLLTSRVLWV
jgi:class 3 adenylate cyclase